MDTIKSWERPSAAVEGYIVPPGESLERPYFQAPNRTLAGTASSGGGSPGDGAP
jgi:hypothetical protein